MNKEKMKSRIELLEEGGEAVESYHKVIQDGKSLYIRELDLHFRYNKKHGRYIQVLGRTITEALEAEREYHNEGA